MLIFSKSLRNIIGWEHNYSDETGKQNRESKMVVTANGQKIYS
jgi:hypothetical protein